MCSLVSLLNEPFTCEPTRSPTAEPGSDSAEAGSRRIHSVKSSQSRTYKSQSASIDAILAARDRAKKKRRAHDLQSHSPDAVASAGDGDGERGEQHQSHPHLADSGAGHVVLRRIIEDDAARLSCANDGDAGVQPTHIGSRFDSIRFLAIDF